MMRGLFCKSATICEPGRSQICGPMGARLWAHQVADLGCQSNPVVTLRGRIIRPMQLTKSRTEASRTSSNVPTTSTFVSTGVSGHDLAIPGSQTRNHRGETNLVMGEVLRHGMRSRPLEKARLGPSGSGYAFLVRPVGYCSKARSDGVRRFPPGNRRVKWLGARRWLSPSLAALYRKGDGQASGRPLVTTHSQSL